MPARPTISRLAPLLILSVLALGGCGKGGSPPAKAASDPPGGAKGGEGKPVPVAVEPVHLGEASNYYTATASLEPENAATLMARSTGVVREVLHEEGDHVSKGDLLLRLEDDEAKLRVKQAEANALAAKLEHDRKASMRDAGLLSSGEFEAVENNMRQRDAELGLANLALDYTHVTAPFSGRVTRRLVNLGANVTPGVQLFELMNDEPMLARVHVPARRMGQVAPGQRIAIRLDSANLDLEGVVTLVSPIVDEGTGTVKVTAEVRKHPVGIRPGDFAEVRIVTERHSDAKLVPSRSIVEDEGESIVYVISGGKAARRVVKPGFVEGDVTEIVSGLEKDELICVKGQRDLRDGQAVEVLEGPGAPAVAGAATPVKVASKTT